MTVGVAMMAVPAAGAAAYGGYRGAKTVLRSTAADGRDDYYRHLR